MASAEKAPLLSHGAAAIHDEWEEERGVAGLVFRLEKRVASLVVAVAALAVVVLVAGISLVAVSPSPQLQHHSVVARQWSRVRDPGETEAADARAEQPGEVLHLGVSVQPGLRVWKTVTNPKKRLVFFMGAEGTGHHFFINQVTNGPLTTRTFGRDYCSDPANAELCEVCVVHECAMTGVDISPELFEDIQQGADHLYDFITPWNGNKANKDVLKCVNNPKYAWKLPSSEDPSARAAMGQRPGYVSCRDATRAFLTRFARAPVAPADRPSYMVVNGRFSYGQFQLDSYPTLMHPQYPGISLFARLAEAAEVDLRVLVMLRDPVRALRSVAARFGTGGDDRPDSAGRVAPQAVHEDEETRQIANGALLELAQQAYGVMTDELSQLDARFYTCWVYDPAFPLETSIFNTPEKRSVQEFFDLRSDEIHSIGADFRPSNELNAEFGKWGDRDTELVTMAAQAYTSLGGEAFWHSKEYIKVPIMNGIGAGTTASDGLMSTLEPLMSRVDFQVRYSMLARVSFLKQAELELGQRLTVQEVGEYVRKENELYRTYWMFRSSFCGHIPVDFIGV